MRQVFRIGLATGLLMATVGLARDAETEQERFQGNWNMVQGFQKGEKISEQAVKDARLMLFEDRHTVWVDGQFMAGAHKLDPSQSPKTIDVTDDRGPYKGKTCKGIYELEGDRMRVAFAAPGEDRPKEFSESANIYHVWNCKHHWTAQEHSDLQKFQGTWRMLTGIRDGQPMDEKERQQVRLVIEGNMASFPEESEAGTAKLVMFDIDASKQPKTIDAMSATGPDQGKACYGIYESEGNRHRVCFAMPGKDRPTEFTSEPGSGRMLQTWERVGPGAETATRPEEIR